MESIKKQKNNKAKSLREFLLINLLELYVQDYQSIVNQKL